MTTLHVLTHTIVRAGIRSRKGIGKYTSASRPQIVIAQLQGLPGFRDPRGSFKISPVELGHVYLPDGYDTANARPMAVPGVATAGMDDHIFSLDAVNQIDAPEMDDDFILLGLFASKADARMAAVTVGDRVNLARYRLGVHDAFTDQVGFSTGFGFDA
jgi:hypothetical protein